MPHLDVCSYIVQYNWTVITFFVLYVQITVKYLPQIGKILHTRLRKIMQVAEIEESSAINASSSSSVSILKNSVSL